MAGKEFPQYLMFVDNVPRFMTLREAGYHYDSGWQEVTIGQFVLEDAELSVRRITDGERNQIRYIADKYSSSK